jgi:hypothetical protein
MLCALQEKNPAVVSYLVDPPGSGLYHLVTKGVMFHPYGSYSYNLDLYIMI